LAWQHVGDPGQPSTVSLDDEGAIEVWVLLADAAHPRGRRTQRAPRPVAVFPVDLSGGGEDVVERQAQELQVGRWRQRPIGGDGVILGRKFAADRDAGLVRVGRQHLVGAEAGVTGRLGVGMLQLIGGEPRTR